MKSRALDVLTATCTALCLVAALSTGCGKAATPSAVGNPEALTVKAIQVQPTPETYIRKLPGVVKPEVETSLGFLVKGKILDMPVLIGECVKEGQVLARLEQEDYRNAVLQAEGALARAKAMQLEAGLQYERAQNLWTTQDVDGSSLDKARAYAQSADNEVRILTLNVSEMKRKLGYTVLTAPYNGIVADKLVQEFDTVGPGQPVLLLVDTSKMKVSAQIPGPLMVEADRFVGFACVFPLLGGLRCEAELLGIGRSALLPARTFPITVEIHPSENARIMPGMEALMEITVRRKSAGEVIHLPLNAIATTPQGQSFVWVVDVTDGTVSTQEVQLGKLTQDQVEITSGLKAGKWVVTAGLSRLKPGDKVHIMNARTASDS